MARTQGLIALACMLPFAAPYLTTYSLHNLNSKHSIPLKSLLGTDVPISSGNVTSSQSTDMSKARELMQPFLNDDLLLHTISEWTRPLPPKYLLRPVVLVGPSGVGKGRIIKSLLKDYSRFFCKVISHTTRAPRPGEVPDVHYHYIDKNEFIKRVEEDFFVEWAEVHGNYYGTSLAAMRDIQIKGKISILEIDIQGARSIRKVERAIGMSPRYIFLAPPSIDLLKERLDIRGTESDEQKQLRLKNAEKEIEESKTETFFHMYLVNDDIDVATNALFRKIRDWFPSLPSAARIRMLQRRLKNIKQLLQNKNETRIGEETL